MEYVPADDADRAALNAIGTVASRGPRTQAELLDYVEWAAPRARKLGTFVTPAELRAIGFIHGLVRESLRAKAADAEKLAAGAKLASALEG